MNFKYMSTFLLCSGTFLLSAQEYSFEKEIHRLKSPKVQLDHTVKLSSTPSVRISDGQGVSKRVSLEPGSRYRLTFYVKGKNVSSGRDERNRRCGGRFYVNNGKKWLCFTSRADNAAETGTFDWRKGEGIIDTNVLGEKINLNLSIFGKGTVYFDKIRLKKLSSE
ncbi:MAG: hypothetical protein IJV93_00090 [Lentisphaeria bacterium]|nr:hypothetical protein [Lentisphaeria bacterium]